MTTDIQSHKMLFLQEYLRLNDEQIINKLSNLLHQEKSKKLNIALKPMTQNELSEKLEKIRERYCHRKYLWSTRS